MKFTYAYKTRDGVRHEDAVEASSREAAFAALRARGVKAIKVVAVDGSKANGEVRGVRLRAVVASVCAAALVAGLAVHLAGRVARPSAAGPALERQVFQTAFRSAKPLARQTINGDRRRIEAAAASFTNAAERLLAAFAEPGRPTPPVLVAARPPDAVFEAALRAPILVAETDFTEAVDLKRIVVKLKSDLRRYLAEGGDVGGYLEELVRRQKLELSYREKAERSLARLCASSRKEEGDKAAAYGYWLRANAQLRSMGIYPLPLPDVLRGYEAALDLDEE